MVEEQRHADGLVVDDLDGGHGSTEEPLPSDDLDRVLRPQRPLLTMGDPSDAEGTIGILHNSHSAGLADVAELGHHAVRREAHHRLLGAEFGVGLLFEIGPQIVGGECRSRRQHDCDHHGQDDRPADHSAPPIADGTTLPGVNGGSN